MTEKIDELFNYDTTNTDKSPAGQREANKPKDKLAQRQKSAVIKDPKGYKDMMKGRGKDPNGKDPKKAYRARMYQHYNAGGPKGKLPEGEQAMKQKEMIKFFEAAGIDPTKGKAKKLVEAVMSSMLTYTYIIEDHEGFLKDGPISREEMQSFRAGQKFVLSQTDSELRMKQLTAISKEFIKNCGPDATQVEQDMSDDSELNQWIGHVLSDTEYKQVVMWSVEYDVSITAIK